LRGAVIGKLPTLEPGSGTTLQGEPAPGGLVDIRGADPTLGGLLGGDR
jgi:phospholipid/cholesterol/gamma-HCH transport system substrate-binding protein